MMILGSTGLCGTVTSSSDAPALPKAIGAWTKAGTPRVIDAKTIFEYMDGAGEMYLAFGFDRLEVTEYKAADKPGALTVEVYFMKSPADAFGLLSQDWGGEPVKLTPGKPNPPGSIAPAVRALYGGGLLRLCAGPLYARITAERETPASREAVIALGKAVAIGREFTAEPVLLDGLPSNVDPHWTLRRDRLGYFRSHLVLNSLFYLSHKNILDLGLDTEGVVAPYENGTGAPSAGRFHLLVIHYPTGGRARQALEHFIKGYLPEAAVRAAAAAKPDVVKVEDGWAGLGAKGEYLVLVMGSPDRETAAKAWAAVRIDQLPKEVDHEKK